jgi:C4-dicarboxylate-specific signal transduction histidine kinase
MVIFAALLLQAALISWLIYEHRRRSRAEMLARSSMAELTHMDRLATAGELSASIAHEVNQPITGIVMKAGAALRWLSTDVPNTQKVRDLLGDIVSTGHRASEVVAGVRTMFQKDTNERVPVDINKLVLRVLEILRFECAKSGVEVQTDLADQLPEILGANVQLQQVVLNLVMNAIEAMHSVSPRLLRIQTLQSGPGTMRVSVEDSGVGIDPSNVERVFDRLFTTKSHGMGLGLAICRSIIENHDGRIWVSPGVNRGAIFQFELPTKPSNASSVGSMAA